MAVHSLADELKLETYGSMDMENNRSLSPDMTNQVLFDLLTIHDDAFTLKKMSKISSLECGIEWATGKCIGTRSRRVIRTLASATTTSPHRAERLRAR